MRAYGRPRGFTPRLLTISAHHVVARRRLMTLALLITGTYKRYLHPVQSKQWGYRSASRMVSPSSSFASTWNHAAARPVHSINDPDGGLPRPDQFPRSHAACARPGDTLKPEERTARAGPAISLILLPRALRCV